MNIGVARISRLLKFAGLFCKGALYNRRYSAKETYDFKEPTNRSHPIDTSRMYVYTNSTNLYMQTRSLSGCHESVCVCEREKET